MSRNIPKQDQPAVATLQHGIKITKDETDCGVGGRTLVYQLPDLVDDTSFKICAYRDATSYNVDLHLESGAFGCIASLTNTDVDALLAVLKHAQKELKKNDPNRPHVGASNTRCWCGQIHVVSATKPTL